MNICIKKVIDLLNKYPKAKQWIWLILLWCGGLITVLTFAYPIKWLIKSMG